MFRQFLQEPLYHYPMDRFGLKSPILYRPEHRIVHIGGGPNRNHPQEWNLNLFRRENIDVVGDAQRLPLADESVDVIISNAVLEHVRDLPATLAEMRRVLKPGGYVYVEIPFMQHYHTHDVYGVQFEDYRRLTRPGLRQAFDFCTPLETGVCVGPTSALLQILHGYLAGLGTSPRHQRSMETFWYLAGNLTVWLDGVLPEQVIERSTVPSGVYFFGRKPDEHTAWLLTLPTPNSAFPRDVVATIRHERTTSTALDFVVTNSSRTTWLRSSQLPWGTVNVAVQPGRGSERQREYRRVALPEDVSPGASFPLQVDLGDLPVDSTSLTIELVIEGLCWFSDRGSPPLTVRLRD